jgi:hypothetical protein|tara:strand:- start:83 stop:295 length:213 start_codon:yes stop_codon:yes gene_type:complete
MAPQERIPYLFLLSVINAALWGLPLKFIWNFALVPAIDGLNYIVYAQAVCIIFASTLLFKNSNIKSNKDE